MKIRGVDFVMLPVADLAAAARFYRDVLGIPQSILSEEDQWAEFDCGNVTLALMGGERPAASRAAEGRIALAVEDIHAAFVELQHQGATVVGEPTDHGVCWHLEVRDPDGHAVILHRRADGTAG